eukprot:PhF_6_TR20465/c0_g1_i1/m.29429
MLTRLAEHKFHSAGISFLHAQRDSVVSGSLDGTVVLWDVATPTAPKGKWVIGQGNEDDDGLNCGAAGPNHLFVVGGETGVITLVDTRAPAPNVLFKGVEGEDSDAVNALQWLSDWDTICAGTENGMVMLFDIRKMGQENPSDVLVGSLDTATMSEVACITEGPGNVLWVGTGGGTIIRICQDAAGPQIALANQDYEMGVNLVSQVPWDPNTIVVASGLLCHQRSTANEDMDVVRTFASERGHSDYVRSIAYTVEQEIFTCGDDGLVCKWSMTAAGEGEDKLVNVLGAVKAHGDSIMAMSAVMDEKLLVTGAEDETVVVWRCT